MKSGKSVLKLKLMIDQQSEEQILDLLAEVFHVTVESYQCTKGNPF